MSKKRPPQRKPPEKRPRRRLSKTAVVVIAICVVASGAVLSRYEPLRRQLGLPPAGSSQSPPSGNPSLAKEYIYAGGRLIATEEPTGTTTPTPTPTPAGPAPTNLHAEFDPVMRIRS